MSNTIIRIITFLVIVVILAVVAGGVYLFFFNNNNTAQTEEDESSVIRRTFAPLFGTSPPTDAPVDTDEEQNGDTTPSQSFTLPPLYRVWDTPVAGAQFITATNTEIVRVVDARTGHVHDVSLTDGSRTQITNTTLPQIQNVEWLDDDSLIIQYIDDENLDTVRTFVADIEFSTSTDTVGMIAGEFITDNIDTIATRNGEYTYMKDGQLIYNDTIIFESPLTGWQVEWIDDDTLLVTTNASALAPGVAYEVTTTGASGLAIPATNGLTTLPSENSIAYASELDMRILSRSSGTTTTLTSPTFADKCVWGALGTLYCAVPQDTFNATLPDVWYQGAVSFSDTIWNVEADEGYGVTVFDPDQNFDIVPLETTPTESRILFINRVDQTLWVYTLE